jgi:lipopolysaccharide biosynthesis protein
MQHQAPKISQKLDDLPLVSVIIRSMDRPTLSEALDSVALQTYANIEVVVVNAKGVGHSLLSDWCGNFPLRTIGTNKPLLRSRAANFGLDNADGDYFIFLDDDDWFEPDHIQKLADAIRLHPEFKVVYTGVKCVDEQKNSLPNKFDTPFDALQILVGNFIPIHAVLFLRDLLELGCRLDESLDLYEDWNFWIQLSGHGDFLKIDGQSAVYRITQQSGFGVNADLTVAESARWMLYKKLFNQLGDHQIAGLMETVRQIPIKDNRIFTLNQALAERDGEIAERDGRIAERDGEIAERDGEIAERDGRIAERDGEIAERDERIAERDGRIAERDGKIAERDGKIASLHQSADERDRQIANLVAERDSLLNSNSWALTRPARLIGKKWKQLRRIVKLMPSAVRHGGGIKLTMGKAVRIYKNEGVEGVRRALLILPASMPVSPQAGNEITGNKHLIPRIDFDQTRDLFVEYKKNPPIDPLVKLIAFYLPQFHPFPENDEWWGKGFTEWTNVGKAVPNYVGHYQPHCPIHHGYYDLRVPGVMEEQAKLAQEYGIYGFSYYFYWFDGKILMDTPLEMKLTNKSIDIPFCLTWANENWSRRWDGQENDILISQNHSDEDSLAFIRHLVKYFKDERYIRINGKPILIIYRANIIPNMAATAKIWRNELLDHGILGLYLVSAQTFGIRSPKEFDFDASVEFPPHTIISGDVRNELELINPNFNGHIYSYEQVVANAVLSKEPDYKLYRTAMLSWDNTARKQNNSHIFHGFSLLRYKQWLSSIINKVYSNQKYSADEKIVFINAWNEWAEGTHLEPDQKLGYGYLQITYDVIRQYDTSSSYKQKSTHAPVKQNDYAVILHLHYDQLWPNIRDYLIDSFSDHGFDLYVSVTSSTATQKVLKDFPYAYIELVENRGRDILPFIHMLEVIKNFGYPAVCKIHSKRSVYRNDGDNIRDEIFDALMGSKEQVEEIFSRFKNNAQLGMVAPKNYLIEHNDHNMTFDKEMVHRIADHMQINFQYDIFPAGSMFWFSPKSLAPLLAIDDSFFEIESGLADGTCAHAVERMFCQIVKDCNYTIENC